MIKLYRASFALIFLALVSGCNSDRSEFNPDKIISKMSLGEKLDMIGGTKGFYIRGYSQYGIPEIRMADGPVGVRNYGPSTAYPASIALAASWDRDLAAEVGKAIGMEAKARNVHIMLGPGMNIYRGPYCGRNFEYLGEDPYLAGELAAVYIKGMQAQGVVATAKHYTANYQDFARHTVSSDMDERTLHEIYLPAFRKSVEQGNVGAVMTAYNLVNGIHCSEHNYLINEVLKGDWGFEGIVMSDWTSTYDGLACARAGLDLEMPSGDYMHPDTLRPAIEEGLLDEEVINDKIRRMLSLYDRFGFLNNPDISEDYLLDSAYVRSVALEAARGGITLLKNRDNLLPLERETIKKIAVIGLNAHPAVTGGGGSSYTEPLYPVSLYEAIRQLADEKTLVEFSPAIISAGKLPDGYFEKSQFYNERNGKRSEGLSAEFYANTNLEGDPVFTKNFRELNLTLTDSVFSALPEVNYSARFTGRFRVDTPGTYRFAVSGDDGYRLIIEGDTVMEHWTNQPETARTTEMVIKGNHEYNVILEYYQGGGDAAIRLAYDPVKSRDERKSKLWDQAVKLASTSDVVIIGAGFDEDTEHEGEDRALALPYGQDEMITRIAAINKNCIVVVNAGGNISMPWVDDIKGLVYAWYPGQEGNIAVAEILFGITNPSGKLPASFGALPEDNPTHNTYFDDDQDNHVYFHEGIFMGYRGFDKKQVKPRFPFGYGLSYTEFQYSGLTLEESTIAAGDPVKLSFSVTNTGSMTGHEICQVYVSDVESTLERPEKELKEFLKIKLEPGETQEIQINLNEEAFKYYDPDKGGWIVEPGSFIIRVGGSSDDLTLEERIIIE